MNWKHGLRHAAVFTISIVAMLYLLGVSDEPLPGVERGFVTRLDVGFGFIMGWVLHGIYRFMLSATEDAKATMTAPPEPENATKA